MEKYIAVEMAVQAISAKSLPNPASGGIILAESTQKERKPNRIAARKNIAKLTLKKIESFAKFFIAYKKGYHGKYPIARYRGKYFLHRLSTIKIF